MKIYQHNGAGHYIGSMFTVIEQNSHDAELHISKLLLEHGLRDEKLNIKTIPLKQGTVITAVDGDY